MGHTLSTLDDVQERYAWFEQMRATQPVWLDEQSGAFHVFRYVEVERVITDFSSFPSQGVCNSILGMDPPQHRSYRNLITCAFTPRTIERLKGRVAEITQALLDEARHKGEMDIVTELAYPLPVTVIAELLGVSPTDQPLFKRWADGLLGQQLSDARLFQPDEQEIQRLGQVHAQMQDYFIALLEERTHAPLDDLISVLLRASTDGKRLSGEEVIEFCKLLLVAGHVTTTDLLSQAIRCFDEHPDVLEQVRKQPELLPGAVEEVLRFASPFWRLTRMTRTEVRLAGTTIPAGTLVFAWLASANRDAEVFPDSERFDITRSPNRHLAFGRGIHFCLGAPLARMETMVALPMILQQLPNVRVIREKPLELFEGEFVFGLKHLPVQFDTEAEKRGI
ncbi:putative cytochrome P450 YjiB [Reticulibacter mediterranei]|uniref:Putative cytochrome P450 YjiB n=1 Tax=Reticulibacter mediterranei TaxID=2778369 RepID=A0A8J3ID02_9CHLR|nr:cytochrome P450 [Reticulibacter mediterranei]GHO90238.1 putative cytochrome P450 YjiB [Reticulibacter mediterranei]